MGFRTGAICYVWDAEPIGDKKVKLRVSISRKNKSSGEYVQDFSEFPVCYGSVVAKQASALKRGDKIKLGDVDVTTDYNEKTKTTYYNFKIFSFEDFDVKASNSGGKKKATATKKASGGSPVDDGYDEDGGGDDLPF